MAKRKKSDTKPVGGGKTEKGGKRKKTEKEVSIVIYTEHS
jgi:hypothetical protein